MLLLEVPSPSQTASVLEEHQAERKANNIMEIETLPDSNHPGGGHILNHAIKAYAQCRSAEKKKWPNILAQALRDKFFTNKGCRRCCNHLL